MGPTRVGCVICGFLIYNPIASGPGSWLREFRAIYSCPSGTFVSGVGCHEAGMGST
ncbi:uncharacterized protein BDR25DRAFT_303374 [Lindgomyces ingoldianus]|uniref:Uncharacterized protein n=1 Tax=Lindgomyces ingoldianus TaxID=673940 RepID=A0ACB6QWF2_9PLEO|nr:uncharacterized protein BDR25DRAFT_303374 [Lindgomyces ingoldianus]KAF2471329.1 hypothetical protein BDR25DRAFT_303374 [Lindgomyces ingoldianus]